MKGDICEVEAADEVKVRRVRERMPSDGVVRRASDVFKLLSEPTRLRILYALSAEPLCVCEIASLLGMNQSAVSHQLRILRSAGIVNYERVGKMARYYLKEEGIVNVMESCEHIQAMEDR